MCGYVDHVALVESVSACGSCHVAGFSCTLVWFKYMQKPSSVEVNNTGYTRNQKSLIPML